MCDQCNSDQLHVAAEAAVEALESNIEALTSLQSILPSMTTRDAQFAGDLIHQFIHDSGLSPRQWQWVHLLAGRYVTSEPIYGSFNAILVMFRLAQSHGLKRPKVRLLSSDPEPVYFELWFRPGEKDERTVEIMVGGWQSHGHRRFGGWIHQDRIIPWRADRITTGMKNTIQDLSLDPQGVAQAMAKRLSACMYCGQRLSDDESKSRGYGATCADHWGQPWGKVTTSDRQRQQAIATDLNALFDFQ